jgi:hypothetical protein
MTAKPMIVAGIMSGTSADGVDVALVRIAPGRARGGVGRPTLTLLAHEGFPYPATLRRAVLAAMNATSTSTAELARLNWRLGLAYAEAVSATLKRHGVKLDLIGCHGQTLYHQARGAAYAGQSFACTWQAGEVAPLAALGIPVVSNFRPADMLAGGQGAPLVPLLDYVLFADAKRGRVLQNIGGIANLTAIPAGAAAGAVVAFDTGPGNMVMDALALQLFKKPFDRNGALAARGQVIAPVLAAEMRRVFRIEASADCGARTVRTRVCNEISCSLPKARQQARGCAGHGNGAGGGEHCAGLLALCSSKNEGRCGGLHRFRRRCAQRDVNGDAGAEAGTAGVRVGHEHGVRIARRGEGGRGVCAAGVADVASVARKCPGGYGSRATGDPGAGYVCLKAACPDLSIPTRASFAGLKLIGWGSWVPTLSPERRRQDGARRFC